MYRQILMASVGAIALAGSAFAADLPSRAPPPVYVPPAPIFTWTGIYIGGQIGYAWGTSNTNVTDNFGDFVSFHTSNSGVIGGAHVGYNLQLSQFVVGLEGDVDGTSLSKSISGSPFIGGGIGANVPLTATTRTGVQGSIRGRLGYVWDRVLLYATGGVAFAGVEGTLYGPFGGSVSSSTTRVGWTVGGGLEYAVTNNWSIRAEYRYAQFGHSSFAGDNAFAFPGLAAIGAIASRTTNENRVQVGFSYKFDTAAPAPVVAKY
jgi:outer membrane immunogenic protein